MMNRKLTTAILAVTMGAITVFAGCGNTENSSNTDSKDTQVSEAAGESGEAAVDELTLTLTTTYSETEYAGQLINFMKDELAEKSGGKIDLDVYWGGTYADNGEELSFVGSGAADMTIIGQSTYPDVLPLLNFPSQVLGGYEEAIALMDDIVFHNEKTSAAVQAQIEAQNVKMLGSLAAGCNSFVSKSQYTSLAELSGKKLGVGMQQGAFEELGMNVVTVMPWDYYDNLSRGIADIGYMSTSALVSMSIQDVTPYFLADGTYTAGNFITVNLDKWNSMSESTQALFREVVADTQQYSIDLSYELDEEASAVIEKAGGALTTLSAEDQEAVQAALFHVAVTDARNYAESAGCTDDMDTVLNAVSEKVGIALN